MQVTVCDRCKTQEDELTPFEIRWTERRRAGVFWVWKRWELCEGCYTLLVKWLKREDS